MRRDGVWALQQAGAGEGIRFGAVAVLRCAAIETSRQERSCGAPNEQMTGGKKEARWVVGLLREVGMGE